MTHCFLLPNQRFVSPAHSGVFGLIPLQEIAEDQKIPSNLPLHLSHWLILHFIITSKHHFRNLDFEHPTPWSTTLFQSLLIPRFSLVHFFFILLGPPTQCHCLFSLSINVSPPLFTSVLSKCISWSFTITLPLVPLPHFSVIVFVGLTPTLGKNNYPSSLFLHSGSQTLLKKITKPDLLVLH